jgi:hypothetical protein
MAFYFATGAQQLNKVSSANWVGNTPESSKTKPNTSNFSGYIKKRPQNVYFVVSLYV